MKIKAGQQNCFALRHAAYVPHRRFKFQVVLRDPATSKEYRCGIAASNHSSDWYVRKLRQDDLIKIHIIPNQEGGNEPGTGQIEPFGPHAMHHLPPPLLVRQWVAPAGEQLTETDVLRCPFLLEQACPVQPRIMVLSEYPTAVTHASDFGKGDVSNVDDYVRSLYCRQRYQRWLRKIAEGREVSDALAAFQAHMLHPDQCSPNLGAPSPTEEEFRAAYPVLYTWLTPAPFVGGQRGFREVPKAQRLEDGPVRHLIQAYKPDILVVSGESAIRRLAMLLRPLPMQDDAKRLQPLAHELSDRWNLFFDDSRLAQIYREHMCRVIPVYDLRYFDQERPPHRILPPRYWSEFRSYLSAVIRAWPDPPLGGRIRF